MTSILVELHGLPPDPTAADLLLRPGLRTLARGLGHANVRSSEVG